MKRYTARMSAPLFANKLDHALGTARLTDSEWVAAWKTLVDGFIDAVIVALVLSAIGLGVWYSGCFQ